MMDDGAGHAAGGRFARGLIRLAVGALLLVLALLAAMRLLNWRDDALRPEVMSAAKFTPPDAEAMRRNGFFTLLGLDAPPGQDAHAAGERAYAELTAQLAARRQRGEPHRAVSTLAFTPGRRRVGRVRRRRSRLLRRHGVALRRCARAP